MIKQNLTYNIILSILGIVVGLIVCVVNPESLLSFIFFIIGAIIIITAIPGLFLKSYDPKEKNQSLIISIIMMIVGTILIVYPQTVALIIAGAILIVLPVYRIIINPNHFLTFKKELFKLILGTFLIIFGFSSTIQILLYIIGGLIMLSSLIYMIYNIILLIKVSKKEKKDNEDNEVIDV